MKDTNVLKVEQHDRNVTLPAFLEYAKRKGEFKEFPKVLDILPSLKRGDSYRSLGRSSAGSSC